MTTRTTKPPEIVLHCPSCRAARRARAVGTGTVGRQRRELVMCLAKDCELVWAPGRPHLATIPTAA